MTFSHTEGRTYQRLLGELSGEPTVWAECLFADPISDVAVLGPPDNQELYPRESSTHPRGGTGGSNPSSSAGESVSPVIAVTRMPTGPVARPSRKPADLGVGIEPARLKMQFTEGVWGSGAKGKFAVGIRLRSCPTRSLPGSGRLRPPGGDSGSRTGSGLILARIAGEQFPPHGA